MKVFFSTLLDILAAVFIAGSGVIQYFAARNLGMVRWLNYNENKYINKLPLEQIRMAMLVLAVVFLLFMIAQLMGHSRSGRSKFRFVFDAVMILVTMVVLVEFGVFTLRFTMKMIRAYKEIVLLHFLAGALLVLRCRINR